MQGQAGEVRVRFDGAGQAEHVTANGNAVVEEREQMAAGVSSRLLTAHTMDVGLGPGGRAGKSEVRNAEAVGEARLIVADGAGGGKQTRTEMAGDDLKAQVVEGRRIEKVVGTGHTEVHRVGVDGVDERSAGETTELVFRTHGRGTAPKSGRASGVGELASATQAGHVSMMRKSLRRQGGAMVPAEERSTADRVVYDGDADRVTFTGDVMLENSDGTLWAPKVVAERGSGDATAEGGVRMTYVQAQQSEREAEPVHVVAGRVELHREGSGGTNVTRRAIFFGGPGKLARMWQGPSQVEAPVIELEQGARRLTASGMGEATQVHTVLLANRGVAGKGVPAGGKNGGSVVRILSREMVYTDGLREVVFSGGVTVDDADGRMKAQRAEVYLLAAKGGAGKSESGAPVVGPLFAGGSVDHIVATGKVEIEQPGRHGSGERLVYTAGDGMYVLTGTAAAPPRVEDEAKGTVTGGTMRFHAGDDSVVVLSEGIQSAGAGTKRRTETRVKQ